MPNTAQMQMGMYISIIKPAVFLAAYLLWLPLVKWLSADAGHVRTDDRKWTLIIFAAGAGGLMIWLTIPLFVIGLLMYMVLVCTALVVYILHRNSLVDEFEKVLTVDHIKSLFVNENKQVEKITKGLVFFTANKNKVPPPQTKTPEFFGFKTAQEFFNDALWRRASDIALTPAGTQYQVYFIIDGIAEKQPSREKEEIDFFIRYLKNLADLEIDEKRKPQTGRFTIEKDGQPFGWELTTAGTTAGEQVKLKLMSEYSIMKLPQTGLMPDQLEMFTSFKNTKKGVFIVSGPPKSGVTTTLYAMIQNHDPFMNNINVLEKRPAGKLPNVTQLVYSLSDTGTTTYAKRFQSMLRTGPDIVSIEHCHEDKDIARLASAAAKDNKIVYASLDAASVSDAIVKWLNMTGDKNLAIDNLAGISNQRLVRKLCEQCREPYEPNKDILKKFNIPADKIKVFYRPSPQQYDKHGKPIFCEHCQGTGFYGREAIFECILLNDEIRGLLKKAKNPGNISNILRHARMLYLQEQAIRKVAAGVTSINEVIRALSKQQAPAKKKPAPRTE